jgi:hypothetical protein
MPTKIWNFLKFTQELSEILLKKVKNIINPVWLRARELKLCMNNKHALQAEPS